MLTSTEMLLRGGANGIGAHTETDSSDLLRRAPAAGNGPGSAHHAAALAFGVLRLTHVPGVVLVFCAAVLFSGADAAGARPSGTPRPLVREQLTVASGARSSPHLLLMTVGGPIYCMQLRNLARRLDASLLCTDYGPDRYERPGQRAGRLEDWGDPAYDAAVARLPARVEAQGVKVSKLIVIGVSYSGFANAELVASQPRFHPAALIMIDSYLDLAARFAALPPYHPTRAEIDESVGGTPGQLPAAYARRSPSHHLATLAADIRSGMRFIDVWSVANSEAHEFRGATCSWNANARWLAQLASVLGRPVTGYVTQLRHAHALWDHGRGVLQLAGIHATGPPLPARPTRFPPTGQTPEGSYCVWTPASP